MKTKKIIRKLVVVAWICGAWRSQPQPGISAAHWLVGTWENLTKKGSVYETWTLAGADRLSGKSYGLKGKDTVLFERMELLQKGDSLFYIPQVINQNGGLPVRFAALSFSPHEMIFENKAHDFSQQIAYTRLGGDSLLATISGIKQGQSRHINFPMRRVK